MYRMYSSNRGSEGVFWGLFLTAPFSFSPLSFLFHLSFICNSMGKGGGHSPGASPM